MSDRRFGSQPASTRRPLARTVPAAAATNRDRWLLSYADFVTLLFALFVVLYASAKVDAPTSRQLIDGMNRAFVIDPNAPSTGGSSRTQAPLEIGETANGKANARTILPQLAAKRLEALQVEHGSKLGVGMRSDQRGLVLSLASTEFFPAGGVDLPVERRKILAKLAPLLDATDRPIHFEGHTDDQPISSGPYPSNWELSAARAAAVARYFIDAHNIDPERIATSGYAEFRPLRANLGPSERAQNRRVDIVFLYDSDPNPSSRKSAESRGLSRLLEALPPIPAEADSTLAPPAPGPAPADIPLP